MPPSEPVVASPKPYYCELRAGRTILWCRCGRSKRQPYCDGRSHVGTGFEPLRYTAGSQPEEVLLCGCKRTGTPPFCDGSHSNLPGGYHSDERTDEERARVRLAIAGDDGMRKLDGRCYVVTADRDEKPNGGTFQLRKIIAPSLGAEHLGHVYMEVTNGRSPILSAGGSDCILFFSSGLGSIEISGRAFPVSTEQAAYVRAGEGFQLTSSDELAAHVSICPRLEGLETLASMPLTFDERFPDRIKGVDDQQRTEMGPRYFQMLVDRSIGSTTATQFIGHIPQSRAEMHRHLYEEALIVLSGRGMMWTEGSRTEVGPGDVIFLPRKQPHSLECTDPGGMNVVGVIHPGDNPAINY